MFSVTHESITVPVGRNRKIRTTMKANHLSALWEKNRKLKQTEVAERGLKTYFFLLAFVVATMLWCEEDGRGELKI